jgi:hypothetical protein
MSLQQCPWKIRPASLSPFLASSKKTHGAFVVSKFPDSRRFFARAISVALSTGDMTNAFSF